MAEVDNAAMLENLLATIREQEQRIKFLDRRITQLRIELGKAKDKTYWDDAYFHTGDPGA